MKKMLLAVFLMSVCALAYGVKKRQDRAGLHVNCQNQLHEQLRQLNKRKRELDIMSCILEEFIAQEKVKRLEYQIKRERLLKQLQDASSELLEE